MVGKLGVKVLQQLLGVLCVASFWLIAKPLFNTRDTICGSSNS